MKAATGVKAESSRLPAERITLLSRDVHAGQSDEIVSVVIPCYNEERFILKALEQLVDQYDRDRFEIIVVDGVSVDRTRALIREFLQNNPDVPVRLVDNPARNTPTALNLGIAGSRGNIIVRMDAHAVPCPGYIRRCVEVLKETDVGVVGMPCDVQPGADTLMGRAIASAVSHPFGIGDAKYRLGRDGPLQESVDTVAFACFKKSLWSELGGFNESLITNEDYDFNYRVRRSGQRVILDRTGHSDYFARPTLKALAQQYFRYGTWKAEMIRLHPSSIRMRHVVAPLFVLSLLLGVLMGFFRAGVRWAILAELTVYFFLGLTAGLQVIKKTKASPLIILLMPLVFATIHIAWGSAFLLRLIKRKCKSRRV